MYHKTNKLNKKKTCDGTTERRVSPLEGTKLIQKIQPQSAPTNIVQGKLSIRTYSSATPWITNNPKGW